MRPIPLVLSAALLAPAAPAQAAARPAPDARATAPATHLVVREPAYRLLFYSLDGVDLRAGTTVTFAVSVSGRPFVRETLDVPAREPARGAAVELLAWTPRLLQNLYEAAESGRKVTIAVAIAESPVETLSLATLVERNRRRLRSGLVPVAATPSVSSASGAALLPLTPAASLAVQSEGFLGCRQQCFNAWLTCDSFCVSRPIPNCEERCDSRYDLCLANCECPTSTDSSSTELIPIAFIGYACSEASPFDRTGVRYDGYRTQYKTTTTRRTENCDGSVTEAVVGVTYSPGPDCFHEEFPPAACFPGEFVYPYGSICTF